MKGKFIALANFRDRNNFDKEYSAGVDVSHLPSDVLKSLIDRNMVEDVTAKDAADKAAKVKATEDAAKAKSAKDAADKGQPENTKAK